MMKRNIFFIAFVVSLGGFLFGFDAGIISGVMSYAGPEFNLTEIQSGWVVSSPSFAAMFAMLFSGRFSDFIGRKPLLIIVALLYAISALLSAYANSYEILYIARMVGGLAFGAALVLAPIYIAEIATAEDRGKLVTLQQLNIVFGFFAAFLSNYFFNSYNSTDISFLNDHTVWRWMLGVEFLPAILYFIFLFFIPRSPRWLIMNGYKEKSFNVLFQIHGKEVGQKEILSLEKGIESEPNKIKINIKELFNKSFRFVFIVGTHDLTGGKLAGADMTIDNIVAEEGFSMDAQGIAALLKTVNYSNTDTVVGESKIVTSTLRNNGSNLKTDEIIKDLEGFNSNQVLPTLNLVSSESDLATQFEEINTSVLTSKIEAVQQALNNARVRAGSQYMALESALISATDL